MTESYKHSRIVAVDASQLDDNSLILFKLSDGVTVGTYDVDIVYKVLGSNLGQPESIIGKEIPYTENTSKDGMLYYTVDVWALMEEYLVDCFADAFDFAGEQQAVRLILDALQTFREDYILE